MQFTKRQWLGTAVAALTAVTFAGQASAQAYPERDITAVIQWGAGGGTDVAMRGYAPYAEEALGKKIVLQNKPGAAGAIGANFVLQQPSDGYTLLMGAEPQALFRVMKMAEFDYDQFYPINVAAIANSILLVAKPDAPWNNMQDLLSHVQANPKKVKQYMAGQGTVPYTVNTMIGSLTKFETIQVPFDGDGPAIAALQGGHLDIGFIASGAAIEHVKAGRLKALGVLDNKPFQGIAPMTDAPSLKALPKYLPWGAWYGVFVKKDTPEPVKAKLVAAFKKAGENPQYRKLMEGRGTTMLNLGGADAEKFIKKWQSTTAWLYQNAGTAKVDPATLGIAKP
ncbi:MAG: tripartite tricarboxylate transporter substrate binding protein [Hydrogenophaga sp.]|uniref:Bug family tripartite tricarboxylate transporter substrate binding protein n=1 Tax=Hydrogenophaga sp. TaxID=1904254 RepID=UPI0025BF62E2|nr:tripartite tricarboxylate transporter substrate binding protein [Hydrogenophaga sp.]MBT9549697.1 tripartite tricarboxylate transporter substrate binding protein [Hydrogenophaga sp.]